MEPTSPQIPWPGPKPYEEGDWELFFGRDRDVDIIAQKLATEQLTVLLGTSGSGKTSLIRAGLVPLLRNRRYHPNSTVDEGPVLVFRAWGARSNDTLRDLMEQQLDNALDAIAAWHKKYEQPGAAEDLNELKQVLESHKGKDIVPTIEALAQAVANCVPTDRPNGSAQRAPLILVFDQLEELLRSRDTRSERETGKLGAEMLALIGDLYVRDSPLRMLISMRVEYLHALRPLDRSVARLSERCHYLEAMNTDNAREVVTLVSESPGVIRVDATSWKRSSNAIRRRERNPARICSGCRRCSMRCRATRGAVACQRWIATSTTSTGPRCGAMKMCFRRPSRNGSRAR